MNQMLGFLQAPALLAHASRAFESDVRTFSFVVTAVLIVLLILIAITLLGLIFVSIWRIFVKAGEPGWAAIIPFYNHVKVLEMTSKPLWWVVLMLLPLVNVVICVIIAHRLAACFGKGRWFTFGMIVLPFIFLPILAFGKSQYRNTFESPKPMSDAVKWTIIAMVIYMVLETYSYVLFGSLSGGSFGTNKLTVIGVDEYSGYNYATDDTYVYFNDAVVPGADPFTFTLDGMFAKDFAHVYYGGQEVPGADPDTFEQMGDSYYMKDAYHVYYTGGDEVVVLDDLDPQTAHILGASWDCCTAGSYVADAYSVYSDDVRLEGADPATFTLFDSNWYAKDAQHVYWVHDLVEDVDADTFTELGFDGYGTDAHQVFYAGKVIPGADVATFTVRETGNNFGPGYDAADRLHRYLAGVVVK